MSFGDDRQKALDTMSTALDQYEIRGVTHNIPLLKDVIEEARFREGNISTKYLEEVYPDGFSGMLHTHRIYKIACLFTAF